MNYYIIVVITITTTTLRYVNYRDSKPTLSCKTYESEAKEGGITQQTVCTSILQWSAAWVYAAIGSAGVVLSAIRGWPV